MIYVGSSQQLWANKLNFGVCRMPEDKIMVHFDTNHLFYEQQHGFRPTVALGCHVLHSYYIQWNIGPRVWMMVIM